MSTGAMPADLKLTRSEQRLMLPPKISPYAGRCAAADSLGSCGSDPAPIAIAPARSDRRLASRTLDFAAMYEGLASPLRPASLTALRLEDGWIIVSSPRRFRAVPRWRSSRSSPR